MTNDTLTIIDRMLDIGFDGDEEELSLLKAVIEQALDYCENDRTRKAQDNLLRLMTDWFDYLKDKGYSYLAVTGEQVLDSETLEPVEDVKWLSNDGFIGFRSDDFRKEFNSNALILKVELQKALSDYSIETKNPEY